MELSPSTVAIVALVFFVTSAVGVVTGGQSLVNVPVLILAGMPPREAVATNMLAMIFLNGAGAWRFARSGLIVPAWLPLSAVTVVSSIVGALVAVAIPERAMRAVVAISMAALLVVMVAGRRLGGEAAAPGRGRLATGMVLATVLGVYGGLFSGGYTTLLTMVCVSLLGIPLMQSVATTKVVNLVSCLVASVVFWRAGLIHLPLGAALSIVGMLGAIAGAHLAIARGDRAVRLVFVATVVAMAAKLVYDLVAG